MSRTELTLLVVGAALVAMVFGWALRWLYDRLSHMPHHLDPNDTDAALTKARAEVETLRSALAEARESLRSTSRQQAAEIEALTDGLRSARTRIHDLERELAARSVPPPPPPPN